MKKKLLIVFLNYKQNHLSFYSFLVNRVFNNIEIDILQCEPNEIAIKETDRVRVHYLDKNESLISFFNSNKLLFKQADLLIFEELYTFNLVILIKIILYGHKSLQIVHNANKFLNRKCSFNLRSLFAFIFFKIIKNYIKGIIVVSQTVKEYIIEKKLLKKNVYYLPFNDAKGVINFPNKSTEAPITFTIPGTVNTERRNYKIFLKVFLRILEKHPQYKFNLNLLGKIVKIDEEVQVLIDRFKKTNSQTLNVWNDYIDDKTYENELLNTNFLIGNINVEYTENNVKEIYGQSKETGVLFLMLKYKITTLLPDEYSYSKFYEGLIINYDNTEENLYNTILSLLNSKKYKKNISLANHDNYVQEEFSKIYNDFLDV